VDEDAFRPGTPETDVAELQTVLMAGGPLSNKRGQVLLTNDRLLFSDHLFNAQGARGAGGFLAGEVAAFLERRRQEGKPPMFEFPLTDITRVAHEKKLTVRDILVIEAGGKEHRFAQGWKAWSPLLRRVLEERHGRSIVDEGSESWRVSA